MSVSNSTEGKHDANKKKSNPWRLITAQAFSVLRQINSWYIQCVAISAVTHYTTLHTDHSLADIK